MQQKYELTIFTNSIDNIHKKGEMWKDKDGYKHFIVNVETEKINDDHYRVKYRILKDKIIVYGT